MTGSAGRGEIRRDVIRIARSGKVCLVASIAIRRQDCVIVIDVTLRTGGGYMRPGQWELRLVVIKRSTAPRRCVVTGGATRRESDGSVRRRIGAVEVVLMASKAVGGKGAHVVVVDMAL